MADAAGRIDIGLAWQRLTKRINSSYKGISCGRQTSEHVHTTHAALLPTRALAAVVHAQILAFDAEQHLLH